MSTAANPLRIVTFNNLPVAYNMTQGWAAQSGHNIVLAVTSPGPKTRRSDGYREIAALAGANNVELLSTTRIKSVVIPVVRALAPDLIVSFTFPWLLPPKLLAIPRLGSVNLHPAILPAYRGPNVMRQFYDAAPEVGATLHWMDGEFDTGRILSQHKVALPKPFTRETMLANWGPTMMMAMGEGIAKAIAGDTGTPQPAEGGSYAAAFTEAEHALDIREPARVLQCKATALAAFPAFPITLRAGDAVWTVTRIELTVHVSTAAPGSVLEMLDDGAVVQSGEGALRIVGHR
jgi:methionyl-tRNA formyltransferase